MPKKMNGKIKWFEKNLNRTLGNKLIVLYKDRNYQKY